MLHLLRFDFRQIIYVVFPELLKNHRTFDNTLINWMFLRARNIKVVVTFTGWVRRCMLVIDYTSSFRPRYFEYTRCLTTILASTSAH